MDALKRELTLGCPSNKRTAARPAGKLPQSSPVNSMQREGGVEHVGADNISFGRDYIADWFADTLV